MTTRAEAFQLLGIPVDSDRRTVARAYRRLALATHPDVSSDPAAADRFAAVAAAFAIASLPAAGTDPDHASPAGQSVSQPTSSTIDVTVRHGGLVGSIGDETWRWSSHWPAPAIIAGPVVVRPNRDRNALEEVTRAVRLI